MPHPARDGKKRPLPVPYSTRFNGATTNYAPRWTGIWGGLQVQRIEYSTEAVPTVSFVATWFMAHSIGGTLWTQVGWSQNNWTGPIRHVFQYDTEFNQWRFFDQFSLVDGNTYDFAVWYEEWESGSQWVNAIWWDGYWRILHISYVWTGDPLLSEIVEIYNDTDDDIYLPTFNTMTHTPTYISLNFGNWQLWGSDTPTTFRAEQPYCVSFPAQWYFWQVWRCA